MPFSLFYRLGLEYIWQINESSVNICWRLKYKSKHLRYWTKRGFQSPKWGISIIIPSKFGVKEWKSQHISWQVCKPIIYLQHAGNPHARLTLIPTLGLHLCTCWGATLEISCLNSKYRNKFPPPSHQWIEPESSEERKQSLSQPEGPEYSITPLRRRSGQSPSLRTRKLGRSQVLP